MCLNTILRGLFFFAALFWIPQDALLAQHPEFYWCGRQVTLFRELGTKNSPEKFAALEFTFIDTTVTPEDPFPAIVVEPTPEFVWPRLYELSDLPAWEPTEDREEGWFLSYRRRYRVVIRFKRDLNHDWSLPNEGCIFKPFNHLTFAWCPRVVSREKAFAAKNENHAYALQYRLTPILAGGIPTGDPPIVFGGFLSQKAPRMSSFPEIKSNHRYRASVRIQTKEMGDDWSEWGPPCVFRTESCPGSPEPSISACITLKASAGESFKWSTGATSQEIVVPADGGTYTVDITDSSGCVSTASFETPLLDPSDFSCPDP